MVLFILRKLILQTRMCCHPVGLDVWFLVWSIVDFHTSCVRTAKAQARLRGWAGSPEPSLVAYVMISTIISWAGSNYNFNHLITIMKESSCNDYIQLLFHKMIFLINEPRHKKTCLWDLPPGTTQTILSFVLTAWYLSDWICHEIKIVQMAWPIVRYKSMTIRWGSGWGVSISDFND